MNKESVWAVRRAKTATLEQFAPDEWETYYHQGSFNFASRRLYRAISNALELSVRRACQLTPKGAIWIYRFGAQPRCLT